MHHEFLIEIIDNHLKNCIIIIFKFISPVLLDINSQFLKKYPNEIPSFFTVSRFHFWFFSCRTFSTLNLFSVSSDDFSSKRKEKKRKKDFFMIIFIACISGVSVI